MGDREIKVFGFVLYLLRYYHCVPLTKAIKVFVYHIIMEYKIK